MKNKVWFTLIFIIGISSCTTTITTRMVKQNYIDTIVNSDMIDAISYVLTNNGFDIAMVNENYGLINTNYRKIESEADVAFGVISIITSSMSKNSSYSTYERELMISIQIETNGYTVVPKVKRIRNTHSFIGSTSNDDIEYPTNDSAEGKLVNKIITEINQVLKINDNYEWTEKIINIKDH